MKKQIMVPSASILKKSIPLVLTAVIAACSSSSDVDQGTAVKGIVADGYLQNAEVCLDTNEDGDCSAEDKYPSVFTDAEGKYTIEGVDPIDLGKYSVIAKVTPGETTDSDFPDETLDAVTYTAGLGHAFLSPLTTLVVNESRATGVSLAVAEAKVKASLGITGTIQLLSDDYIALENNEVHEHAQKVARVLSAAHAEAKGDGKEHARDIQAFIQEKINASNISAHTVTSGFDIPEYHSNANLAHLPVALTSYDAVAPHVHDDMANLKVALTGFSDDHGCIAPQEWHAVMSHCMVLNPESDDSTTGEHSDSADVANIAEEHTCPDGQLWHEEMGHCMPS